MDAEFPMQIVRKEEKGSVLLFYVIPVVNNTLYM